MHHEYDVTIRGIHHWSRNLFVSFGCIIMAHHRKHDSRVVAYHDSVNDLLKTIESRLETIHDADKKDDLRITHEHVKLLKLYADKLFPLSDTKAKTKKTRSTQKARTTKTKKTTRSNSDSI